MSGGSFDYFYCQLQDHDKDFGDKELNELVSDLAELFHDRELYLSADTCVGDWNEARDAFKEKWFTEHGRQERIEKYLDELGQEVRESFGMAIRRCRTCRFWKANDRGRYGSCKFEKCLMHRAESCEKWESGDAEENESS